MIFVLHSFVAHASSALPGSCWRCEALNTSTGQSTESKYIIC